MLVGIIRDNKNNYYINLLKEKETYYYNIICTNNEKTFNMNDTQITKLFKELFSSELVFLKKEKEYDVYLDEANNKRYFKNAKEDFHLFFEKNGTSAILYNSDKEKNKSASVKKYTMKNSSGTKTLISAASKLSLVLLIVNVGLVIGRNEYINNFSDLQNTYGKIEAYITNDTKITLEEAKNCILHLSDESLSNEYKKYLANINLLNDVLETGDVSRNYVLRKKLNNISISYFTPKEKELHSDMDGYYNPLDSNIIHLRDNSIHNFHSTALHEFIHLLQDNNQYDYILEASAEIMKAEYFNEKADSYLEPRKRLCVLMEMIGPKPVMECNFKGDTSTFENAIYNNLDEKEAKHFLELFTKSPFYDENSEETNKEIDQLLAKMYKNITGNNISDDQFINYIYENDKMFRTYFNQNTINFYKNFKIGDKSIEEEIDLETAINSDLINKFYYTKQEKITEEEYNNFVNAENQRTFVVYKTIDGYKYNSKDYTVSSTNTNETYTIEDALKKGLVDGIDYYKEEELSYNTLEELKKENPNIIFTEVLFKNGDYGSIFKNNESYVVTVKNYDNMITEPSVAEKFPNQVKDKNLVPSNNHDLKMMLLDNNTNNQREISKKSR